jgi:hypothetical protein
VPVELREGNAIENITWTPEVEIRNNFFARIPTRGVLVTTRRKVVIENNRLYPNAELLRLSACNDVEIADNSINGRMEGLSVRFGLMAQDALHGFTEQKINLTEDMITND